MKYVSAMLTAKGVLIAIRTGCEPGKRAISMTLLMVNLVLIEVLFMPSVSADSARQTMKLSWQDTWYYEGEVRRDYGNRGECHNANCPYCTDGFCAHGIGYLGHDGSWDYEGSFVDGVIHGKGTYSGDFYKYVGGFEKGKFHGYGIYEGCGGSLKGKFTHGRFPGKAENWFYSC